MTTPAPSPHTYIMDMPLQDFHLPQLNDLSTYNILYVLVVLCIVYKLAFISGQLTQFKLNGIITMMTRLSGAVLGTILVMKAYGRIHGGDPAALIDVLRELSWCPFLLGIGYVLSKELQLKSNSK